jgi:hypothetical protein
MAKKNEDEFVVSITTDEGEELRGKFKVKVKPSYRDILNMDAARRSLLGPQGGDVDALAALIASNLAEIQTMSVEVPSWWKDAKNGLDFDDINVIIKVAEGLHGVQKAHLKTVQDEAAKAKEDLA